MKINTCLYIFKRKEDPLRGSSYLEVLGTEKSENPWIEQLTSRLLSQADWFLSPTALFFHRVGLIQNKWTIL